MSFYGGVNPSYRAFETAFFVRAFFWLGFCALQHLEMGEWACAFFVLVAALECALAYAQKPVLDFEIESAARSMRS